MAKQPGQVLKTQFATTDAKVRGWLLKYREARYRIGLGLLDIQDGRLWKDGNHATFYAYLDALMGPSRRTLQRYMALAYQVDGLVAKAFDAERIEAALVLLPNRKGTTIISLKAIRALKVEVERNGALVKVPFRLATTDELKDAVTRRGQPALPRDKDVERLRAATVKLLGEGPGAIGDVGIRRRGKRTVLVVEIPIERGEEFLRRFR